MRKRLFQKYSTLKISSRSWGKLGINSICFTNCPKRSIARQGTLRQNSLLFKIPLGTDWVAGFLCLKQNYSGRTGKGMFFFLPPKFVFFWISGFKNWSIFLDYGWLRKFLRKTNERVAKKKKFFVYQGIKRF